MAIAHAAAGLPAPTASVGAPAPTTPSLAFLKRRCATALRDQPAAAEFLAAFLSSQPGAEALAAPEEAADADYRYLVELRTGVDPQLSVQGWRRLPGITTWHPRCGPMALALFIERFLPGGVDG
jgi:hypothetical protein